MQHVLSPLTALVDMNSYVIPYEYALGSQAGQILVVIRATLCRPLHCHMRLVLC